MISRTPPAWRVLEILVRSAVRRRVNRLASVLGTRRREAPDGAGRPATPGRARGGSRSLLALMLFGFLMSGVNMSHQLATRLIEEVDGRIPVSSELYLQLLGLHESWRAEGLDGPAPERQHSLETALDREAATGGEALEVDQVLEALRARGLDGFRRTDLPGASSWPGNAGPVVDGLALVLLLLGAALVLLSISTLQSDFGQVSWQFEWLFTFPVPARTLLGARLGEYALTNPWAWLTAGPLLSTFYWISGHGPLGIVLGLAATVYLATLVASIHLVVETALRRGLSPGRLKDVQALAALGGSILLFVTMAAAVSPGGAARLLDVAGRLPRLVRFNPFSLPARLCAGASPGASSLVLLALGAVVPIAASRVAAWFVRDGLVGAGAPAAGRRSRSRAAAGLGGVAGKEIRLLARDRHLTTQTLIVPVLVIGFNLLISPRAIGAILGDVRHSAALAFGLGAYVLAYSATHVLSVEGPALWLLYTFPRPLEHVLRRKVWLWAGLASLYTIGVLVARALAGGSWGPGDLAAGAFALAGVSIHAWLAAGLGILGADPTAIETRGRRKIAPEYVYLYLLLAGLFGTSLYSPHPWPSFVLAGLSAAIAFAVWQRARDQLPYLLEPSHAPPRELSLADGLVAVLVFFVAQGVLSILLPESLGEGGRLLVSFLGAGALSAGGSLYGLWRLRVVHLAAAVGLVHDRTLPAAGWGRSILVGFASGLVAAGAGVLYLIALHRLEFLRPLRESAGPASGLPAGTLLVLTVIAAPLVEEFVFRGLLFRGLRRTASPRFAILASAALFAAVHPPVSFLPVFGLGVAAAASFERCRLLVAPIAAHVAYNATIVAANALLV